MAASTSRAAPSYAGEIELDGDGSEPRPLAESFGYASDVAELALERSGN